MKLIIIFACACTLLVSLEGTQKTRGTKRQATAINEETAQRPRMMEEQERDIAMPQQVADLNVSQSSSSSSPSSLSLSDEVARANLAKEFLHAVRTGDIATVRRIETSSNPVDINLVPVGIYPAKFIYSDISTVGRSLAITLLQHMTPLMLALFFGHEDI